jgi:hypothetical protein
MKIKDESRIETIINFPYFKLQYNKTITHNYNVGLSLCNTAQGVDTKQFLLFFSPETIITV